MFLYILQKCLTTLRKNDANVIQLINFFQSGILEFRTIQYLIFSFYVWKDNDGDLEIPASYLGDPSFETRTLHPVRLTGYIRAFIFCPHGGIMA